MNHVVQCSCRGYQNLAEAAELGHVVAMEKVSLAYLFGSHLQQNLTKARELFGKLSDLGSPRGQLVRIPFLIPECLISAPRKFINHRHLFNVRFFPILMDMDGCACFPTA